MKTCDPRLLPYCLLYLHIMRKSKWCIGAMKYIPTCKSIIFVVRVLLILVFLQWWPTSVNLSSAALSFWHSRSVSSAMYCFQSGLLHGRSLIWITQWLIRRPHCLVLVPWMLMILMDWAISQMRSLTLLSIYCVVKPLLSCRIPIDSAAHWVTPTPAFLAQMQTSGVGIWIGLVTGMTDFGYLKASHYILNP